MIGKILHTVRIKENFTIALIQCDFFTGTLSRGIWKNLHYSKICVHNTLVYGTKEFFTISPSCKINSYVNSLFQRRSHKEVHQFHC
jgi:hypothetical protein